MKTGELKALGLNDEQVDSVMAINGKDVNSMKAERDARADIKPDDLEALRNQLQTATEAAKAYEGVDVAALKASLTEAQSASEALKASHVEQVNALAADLLLREKLAALSFSSDYARDGVFSDIKREIKYKPGEGGAIGSISGYDEALSDIRENKPSAFAAKSSAPPKPRAEGREHTGGGDDPPKRAIPTLI